MEQEHQFIDYIEQSIIKNWDKDALTDYKGITLQYKDVARKIAKFHIVLESAGIQPGDKIAVCGRNSAHWAVTFLATIRITILCSCRSSNQLSDKRIGNNKRY